MNKLISAAIIATIGASSFFVSEVLYQSDEFTVYSDKVVQGEYVAKAESRNHIISTYRSLANTNYPPTISFKFSINGKDNEAAPGQDHRLTIIPENGSFTSPVILFGAKDPDSFVDESIDQPLPKNTKFTVRVDMSEVLSQFEEKGFYEAWSGETISASEFKGVYIAGGSAPLSWDFDNLHNNPDYRLHDKDNDGIYETTVTLNPYDPEAEKNKEWKLQHDISSYPSYRSDQVLIDALYNMSLDETQMLIEEDSTFRTGAKWEGVWTRDISYSVLLSYAFLEPDIAKKSLMRKVNRDRIIQDTGSGGAWPVSSDRVVWSLAAWEIYKVTGDQEWLETIYPIIKNSLEDDLEIVYDEATGLFKGESSFLDWREQSYPGWMDNADISQSINLGTNAVFYKGFQVMSEIAGALSKEAESKYYKEYSERIKSSLNEYLWNENRGYYNQYLYGRHYLAPSKRFEALGESLTILFDIADEERSEQIISNSPAIPYGIPTIYPQIPDVPPYHNNGVWPFVQAYWNWAAAKVNNEAALNHGLASLYRSAALFVTNKENFVAETGDYEGTQINSDRQQWSVAGNLAMVYRVFLGMKFETDGMVLEPTIPEAYSGKKIIKGFRYRNAILNFEIEGFGSEIAKIYLDEKKLNKAKLPANISGEHTIQIVMQDVFGDEKYQILENKFSLPNPRVQLDNNTLSWQPVQDAMAYMIYKNGEYLREVVQPKFKIKGKWYGQYQVSAVGENGIESFLSEPVFYLTDEQQSTIEVESFSQSFSSQSLINYSGQGAVEISTNKNRTLNIPVTVSEPGSYLLSVRYSNGTGPWNTDNNCAIRSLYVDDNKAGALVLPQRGEGEWSNWGWSNLIKLTLNPGEHQISIRYDSSSVNMDGKTNQALLDQIKLIKVIP